MTEALQELEQLRLPEGDKVFSQGEPSDAAFLIVKGKVGVHKTVDGRRIHLRTLMAGAIFGVTAVVDGGTRPATATTVAPSVLVRIPATVLHAKIDRADPLLRQVVTTLAENLRDLHRLQQMRPRSLHDYIRVLQEQSDNLRKYVINNSLDVAVLAPLTAEVERLDEVIAGIHRTVAGIGDRRADAIFETETVA